MSCYYCHGCCNHFDSDYVGCWEDPDNETGLICEDCAAEAEEKLNNTISKLRSVISSLEAELPFNGRQAMLNSHKGALALAEAKLKKVAW